MAKYIDAETAGKMAVEILVALRDGVDESLIGPQPAQFLRDWFACQTGKTTRSGWKEVDLPQLGYVHWLCGSPKPYHSLYFTVRLNGRTILDCSTPEQSYDPSTKYSSFDPAHPWAGRIESWTEFFFRQEPGDPEKVAEFRQAWTVWLKGETDFDTLQGSYEGLTEADPASLRPMPYQWRYRAYGSLDRYKVYRIAPHPKIPVDLLEWVTGNPLGRH